MKTAMSTSTWSRVWRPSQASIAQPPQSAHGARNADMSSAMGATGSGTWFVVWRETELDKRCSLWWGAASTAEAGMGWRYAKTTLGQERTRRRAEVVLARP